MRVAIVGGTGAFGRALAARAHEVGVDVVIGSRDAARARELAAVLGVGGAANEEAVRGVDLIVIAVPSRVALDTARALDDEIGGTPVLCTASDLRFTDEGVLPGREAYSLAEELADSIGAAVASGLQSLSAASLAHGSLEQDALVCGDDSTAKALALEFAALVLGEAGRALDAGPLANSRALEGTTAVILNLNRRYGGHAGLRITGLG
jgi:NADPH-dependent F420 reductase